MLSSVLLIQLAYVNKDLFQLDKNAPKYVEMVKCIMMSVMMAICCKEMAVHQFAILKEVTTVSMVIIIISLIASIC